MGQTSANPLDALAPVINPLDALAPVKKAGKKPGTESGTAEFLRRMLTQVVSPIDPVHKLGKAAGDVIEGVQRPSTDSSIGAMIKQAAESIKADPVMGSVKTAGSAALGLTGAPSILDYLTQAAGAVTDLGVQDSYSPAARVAQGLPAEPTAMERVKERLSKGATMARGYAGGMVEGVSSLSPLDALMLKLGAKGVPEGLKGGLELGKGKVVTPTGSADLRAQEGGTILSKKGAVVKGRETPVASDVSFGGQIDEPTIREALRKVSDQSRTQRTFISPAEPPPEPKTMGRDQAGKPLPEPGAERTKFDAQTDYTPEERELIKQPLADWAAERPKQAEAQQRPVRAARNAAIDADHTALVREIEKRMREGGAEEGINLPAKGTTRAKAYAEGATPAEAGKAAATARAEGTKAATQAPVEIPKGTDIHAVLQSVEQAAIDRIKAHGTFKGSRLGSGLPVDDLLDLATVGATRIARGALTFADWSADMVGTIGDEIKPHLKEIWTKARDIHDTQFKALMPKAGRAPLPNLPRKGAGPAKAKAAISSSGQLKDALSRDRILKELGGIKVEDVALAKKITRFKYLSDQNYQEGAGSRLTELTKLEKEILAHPALPAKLKERWTKLGTALPEKTQAERNAAARTEAAADKPARLDPKAIEAGRALETRIREMGGNKEIKAAARTVPDEPITQRSVSLAESLIEDSPQLAPKPVATIPPEESAAAIGDSLGRSHSPASLHGLLEQIRGGITKGAENEPGVMEVLRSMGDEATLTPAAKALVDAIEAHITEAGSGVNMDRLHQQQTKERLFTSHRPPPASTIRVKSEALRAVADIPVEQRPHIPKGYGGKESIAWRGLQERLARAARDAKAQLDAIAPEIPTVRSIEDIGLATSKAGTPTTPAARPKTAFEQRAADRAAAGELQHLGPQAEIGPPPPGVEPEHWARINALEVEGRLLQDRGITDPRIISEMREFWGAKEAANRLGLTKLAINLKGMKGAEVIAAKARNAKIKVANEAAVNFVREIGGGPSRMPLTKILEETDARFRHLIDDPNGFMRIESILAGGGAAAGALVGATIDGEDARDRLAYGLSGAIIGGLLGHAGGKGIQYLGDLYSKPKTRADLQNTIEAVDTANLLAGPAIIKTSFGSLGGVAAGLWQRISEGDTRAARAGYDYITSSNGMVKEFFKTLTGPVNRLGPGGPYTNQVGTQMGFTPPNNFPARLARQVLRPFIAGDKAAGEALRRMGFSKEEAGRLQLVGEPTSWHGQTVNNLISSSFALRMLAKFPRVRVGGLERAVEFTPGLHKFNTRSTKASTPQFFRGGLKPQEQLSPGARRARAQFGGAAIVAGTAYGYLMDPSLQHMGVAASVAGPAYLPMAAAMAAGKGIRHGKEPLTEALLSTAGSIPQIGEADVRPASLARRLTPFGPLMRAIERMKEAQ